MLFNVEIPTDLDCVYAQVVGIFSNGTVLKRFDISDTACNTPGMIIDTQFVGCATYSVILNIFNQVVILIQPTM